MDWEYAGMQDAHLDIAMFVFILCMIENKLII
ncbi:hypothetical protein [Faecalibacillus intestinalis]